MTGSFAYTILNFKLLIFNKTQTQIYRGLGMTNKKYAIGVFFKSYPVIGKIIYGYIRLLLMYLDHFY